MMSNNKGSVAIVGGGATGVATFIAAVVRRAAKTIYIIDPRPIGRGVAFSSTDGDMICNTSVDTMSVVPGRPLDFQEYLDARGSPATSNAFMPRSLVGDYLVERFRHYRELASRYGIDVVHLPYRFRSLRIEGHRRYKLRFSEAAAPRSLIVTDVIFCTGYGASRVPDALMSYRNHPTFIGCPYPEAEMLAKVPAKSRVLVIGSKLSAIDTAILLCREGHRVTMLSPSGELPAVRARLARNEKVSYDLEGLEAMMARWNPEMAGPCSEALKHIYLKYTAHILAEHTHKPSRIQFSHASRYDDRLREEIAIAEHGDSLWQDLAFSFIEAWNAVYLKHEWHFTGGFHPGFRQTVYRYLTAVALPNAKKLMHHIDHGTLAIKRGELRDVTVADGGHGWLLDWGEGSQRFDAVVTATGFHLPHFVFNDDGELEIEVEGHRPEEALDISQDMAADDPRLPEKESIWFVGAPAHMRLSIPNALFVVAPLADHVVANVTNFSRGEDTSNARFSASA